MFITAYMYISNHRVMHFYLFISSLRVLLNGGKLIAIHRSPYFKDKDGLSLGPGAFVAALETASRVEAVVVGKPQPAFYNAVLADMSCVAEETVMIGDVSLYLILETYLPLTGIP